MLLAARALPSVRSPSLSSLPPPRSFSSPVTSLHSCIELHQVHLQRLQVPTKPHLHSCTNTQAVHITSPQARCDPTYPSPVTVTSLRLVSSLPLTATPPIRERVSACTSGIIRSISWPVCQRSSRPSKEAFARSLASARPLWPLSFARSLPISGLQPPLTFFIPLDSIFRNPTLPLFKPSRLLDFVFFVAVKQISFCKQGGDRPPGQFNSPALDRRELKRTLHEPLRQPNRTSKPRRNLSPPPPLSSTLHRATFRLSLHFN